MRAVRCRQASGVNDCLLLKLKPKVTPMFAGWLSVFRALNIVNGKLSPTNRQVGD